MDKIFHSTFDFFSYAIPGCCIVFSFFILDPKYYSAEDYLTMVGKLQVGSGVFLLIVGYIVGFAVTPIGRFLYKSLGFKLFDESFKDVKDLSISDKYVLLRELSPNNFKYVETWNMWCTMSHNLAISALLFVLNSMIKIAFYETNNVLFWAILALSFLLLFFLFLYRAVRFSVWAATDINSSITQLHLKARADKLLETEKYSSSSPNNPI
jgi:hypothetical protein